MLSLVVCSQSLVSSISLSGLVLNEHSWKACSVKTVVYIDIDKGDGQRLSID